LRDFMAAAKALSDEGRVRIVAALAGQELCVCELIELLELAPSTVSKHLSLLKHARIIEGRRSGRWTHYRLAGDDAPVEVLAAIEWVRSSLGNDPVAKRDKERISEIVAGRADACPD
jgi:DNA-binding transcriptional ArsR family regulator